MSAAATPTIARDEFERMGARVTALEASRTTTDAEPAPSSEAARPVREDYVRQEEFRLFKWLGTFALATVLGGFALLYEQTSDLRVTMERLHAEMLREMHTQLTSIREQMHAEHASIREEITGVRERVVRLETLDDKT